MSLLPSESIDTPLVRILNQRVGGEKAANDDVCLCGVFDKYSRLQDVTFLHFEQDPATHMLHFHLESHDHCNVKLKPRLWDQGAYFKSNLLTEGALRLIPHFLAITFRPGTAPKRQLSPPMASGSSPKPHKRWVQDVESPTITFEMIKRVRAALPERLDESNQAGGFGEEYGEMLDEDDLAERDAFEREQGRRASLPGRDQDRDHGIFTPRAHHRLPAGVTQYTWTKDFEEACQRYINAQYNGVTPTITSRLQYLRRVVHQEMMRGKYGMDALKSCTRCVEDEEACRVYHSDCYKWQFDGLPPQGRLGWSCVKCRGGNVSQGGGCDAHHVA